MQLYFPCKKAKRLCGQLMECDSHHSLFRNNSSLLTLKQSIPSASTDIFDHQFQNLDGQMFPTMFSKNSMFSNHSSQHSRPKITFADGEKYRSPPDSVRKKLTQMTLANTKQIFNDDENDISPSQEKEHDNKNKQKKKKKSKLKKKKTTVITGHVLE